MLPGAGWSAKSRGIGGRTSGTGRNCLDRSTNRVPDFYLPFSLQPFLGSFAGERKRKVGSGATSATYLLFSMCDLFAAATSIKTLEEKLKESF